MVTTYFKLQDSSGNPSSTTLLISPAVSPTVYSGSIVSAKTLPLYEPAGVGTMALTPNIYECRETGFQGTTIFFIDLQGLDGQNVTASNYLISGPSDYPIFTASYALNSTYSQTSSYLCNPLIDTQIGAPSSTSSLNGYNIDLIGAVGLYNTTGSGGNGGFINIDAGAGGYGENGGGPGGNVVIKAGDGGGLDAEEGVGPPGIVTIDGGGTGDDAQYGAILLNSLGLPPGNVGIGNADPQFNLDVAGDINFTGQLYQNGVVYNSTSFELFDAGLGRIVTITSYNGILTVT